MSRLAASSRSLRELFELASVLGGIVMTPAKFFQTCKEGARIRYGGASSRPVKITYISKGNMFAYGLEEGTNRSVSLYLCSGLLREMPKKVDFSNVELL